MINVHIFHRLLYSPHPSSFGDAFNLKSWNDISLNAPGRTNMLRESCDNSRELVPKDKRQALEPALHGKLDNSY